MILAYEEKQRYSPTNLNELAPSSGFERLLLFLKLTNLNFQLIDCLTEALDLVLETQLHLVEVVEFH